LLPVTSAHFLGLSILGVAGQREAATVSASHTEWSSVLVESPLHDIPMHQITAKSLLPKKQQKETLMHDELFKEGFFFLWATQ